MANRPPDIQIGDEQRRKLDRLAGENGKRASELANEAIDEYCDARMPNRPEQSGETLFEALSRSGSLGCIKDGPADLSTNPKNMEGFGER